jgi:hypothetical protein
MDSVQSTWLRSLPIRAFKSFALAITVILASGSVSLKAQDVEKGFEFEGSRNLNQATVIDTNFVGECPGQGRGSIRGRFYSSAMPPAPGRRVMIRNVTRGVDSDPQPFSDRDYSKGRNSEALQVAIGTRHELKNLTVIEGQNDFEYEIREGNQVINNGTFSAEFGRDEQTRGRNATCRSNFYCRSNSSHSKKKCRRPATRVTCSCPNGSVVNQYFTPYYR